MATQGLHDVYFLSLGEVEDFFGSWANNFIILTNRKQGIVAIDIAIRQHHGWVVLIHHVTRDLADQAGVGTVSHGQGLRQFVQRATAYRAVRALGAAILLVALSVHRVKERLYQQDQQQGSSHRASL